jgi:hypothetical protein
MTTADFAPRSPNMLDDILNANSKYVDSFDKPMSLGAKKKVSNQSAAVQLLPSLKAATINRTVAFCSCKLRICFYKTPATVHVTHHVHLRARTTVYLAGPQCCWASKTAAVPATTAVDTALQPLSHMANHT